MSDGVRRGVGHLAQDVSGLKDQIKPKLRGWLHLVNAPLTLAAGIVLIALSPTAATRLGSAVFTGSALVLFTVSAIYHRGTWSPRVHGVLQRLDHANIFLLIAGSCTPFAILLLDGVEQWSMLALTWGGALGGVVLKVTWGGAPRWLSAPIYIALGWAPVFFFGDFIEGAMAFGDGIGTAVVVLVIVGGGLYTLGGLVYGTRFPDPSPRWFGFHEVFHSFTILAFVSHYVGVSLATYSLR
ncbi:MAG TPA: hemolysin III family protein [Nocardioides sp.]|nr:hemolysin III family protein [Nocardioides sp.]